MTTQASHICVCICTYKRPAFLARLLKELRDQVTEGRFTYSIVICDNDQLRSAEEIVSEFSANSTISIRYCVEPQQSIALARNRAVQNATGDYIAFIDDDEFPENNWLHALFAACKRYNVDGVLGPVKPSFGTGVPRWIVKGRFYDRPCHKTGSVLAPAQTRTGNVLLRECLLRGSTPPFRPEFRDGEDLDFFRRVIGRGATFIWCNEAVVFEVVPPVRWKRSFMLKRALFRGALVPLHSNFGWRKALKSALAVPTYSIVLPITLLLGHHRFMMIAVKLCDHLGLLLALVRIRPLRQAYITE